MIKEAGIGPLKTNIFPPLPLLLAARHVDHRRCVVAIVSGLVSSHVRTFVKLMSRDGAVSVTRWWNKK